MKKRLLRGTNDVRMTWALAAALAVLAVPGAAFAADRMVLCEEITDTG